MGLGKAINCCQEKAAAKKLSIMMPVFNQEKYLDACLQPLTRQDWADEAEIIIIDDGSTDNSRKICEKYAAKYPYIMVYHKENGGVSSARNMALQYAGGEYFYWVDPDDYIADDFWQKVSPVLEQGYDFIFFDLIYLYGDRQKQMHYDDCSKEIAKDTLVRRFCTDVEMPSHLPTKILRKSLWEGIRFSESISLLEDFEAFTHIVPKIQKPFYLHESLYHYRQHSASICHSLSLYDVSNAYRLKKERYAYFKDTCGYDVNTVGIRYEEFAVMSAIIEQNEHFINEPGFQDLYNEMHASFVKDYKTLLASGILTNKQKLSLYLIRYNLRRTMRLLKKIWSCIKTRPQIECD